MTAKQLKVLVVDDDQLLLTQAKFMLSEAAGCDVLTMSHGRDAIDALKSGQRFDLLFLDLNMPEFDGIEVMRELSTMNFDTPIALFSGENERILRTATTLGAEHRLNIIDSLAKPVTRESLNICFDKVRQFSARERRRKEPSPPSTTLSQLRQGIKNNEFEPFFQPKVRIKDRSIHSVEALSRWRKADGSLVSPAEFIPLAEQNGLIHTFTLQVFEKCAAWLSQWLEKGIKIELGFNVSTDSLLYFDLPEQFEAITRKYRLPNRMVTLEITESKLMANLTTSLDVLTRLRLKGFGLSIDDFGTGYSSLSQVYMVPITEIKIDRSFVHGAHNDLSLRVILESSSDMARKLSLIQVAEGVEDQNDWDIVVKTGCELVQGYYIAKPMPAAEFDAWWRDWQSKHGRGAISED